MGSFCVLHAVCAQLAHNFRGHTGGNDFAPVEKSNPLAKLLLLKYAIQSEADTFLVVTESGILHEMQRRAPGKTFIPVPPDDSTCGCNECNFMRLITLEKVYNSLRYEWPEVHVSADIAAAAVKPIERMLDISARLGL